jgi:hypothetical protein
MLYCVAQPTAHSRSPSPVLSNPLYGHSLSLCDCVVRGERVRGAAFEGALSVPSGRRDDRAAVHQQERGDIHTGCVRTGVHVFVCVRLEDMSDDQSTIVYCCKGTKKQSLSLLEINESVFRQSSDIGPAHPLYCTVLYCIFRASNRRDCRGYHQREDSQPRCCQEEHRGPVLALTDGGIRR